MSLPVKIINFIKSSSSAIGIFNPNNVTNKVKYWNKYLPHIKPYYAIKSFNHPYMIDELLKHNISFDVASKGEIVDIIKNGGSYDNMILSNPICSKYDLEYAFNNRVPFIVCDDYERLEYIKNVAPWANILWRIKSYENDSLIKFNNKFGASIDETIRVIEKSNHGLRGISFHVGSNCGNVDAYKNTINSINDYILPRWNNSLWKCEYIDIGGGLSHIEDVIKLSESIKGLLTDKKIIAEPGRYFSIDSVNLYTKIIKIKVCNKTGYYNIFINDSIYSSFSGNIFDKQIHYPIPMYKGDEMVKCSIWGNTCDGIDKIIDDIYLLKPREGDILCWENMGAYTFANAVDGFNGFNKATILNI
jgi:ornithine decarboxylase